MNTTITVRADDWIRSWDELRELVTYGALGARVELLPVRNAGTTHGQERSRELRLSFERLGRRTVSQTDLIGLPALAGPVLERVKTLAEAALRF